MSFDVFVCRFRNAEPAPLDTSAALEVLAPHTVARDPETDFLLLRTAEGEEASVYLNGPDGITFNRFGGDGIMTLLPLLLRRLEAVLVVPGGPTVIQRDEDREHLPASLNAEWPVVVAAPARRSTGRSGASNRQPSARGGRSRSGGGSTCRPVPR